MVKKVQAVGCGLLEEECPEGGGVAGTEGRLGWARQRRTTK